MSGFRGKVRVPAAVLVSRAQRERKVGLYLSEELVEAVLMRVVERRWSLWSEDGKNEWTSVRMHLHDAIRLALYEWSQEDSSSGLRKLAGLVSVRPLVSDDDATRRARGGRAAQRQRLLGVEVSSGGLFYDFRW